MSKKYKLHFCALGNWSLSSEPICRCDGRRHPAIPYIAPLEEAEPAILESLPEVFFAVDYSLDEVSSVSICSPDASLDEKGKLLATKELVAFHGISERDIWFIVE